MNTRILPLSLVLLAGLATLAACDVLAPGEGANANATNHGTNDVTSTSCGDATTVNLVRAGTGRVRGTVVVINNEDYLYVTLTASRPVNNLAATALYVGTNPPSADDVQPATMTNRVEHPGGTQSYTYQIPRAWADGTVLYIAAYGQRLDGSDHWGDGPLVPGTQAHYFEHTVQACDGGSGDQGCGLGYWKNHPAAWGPTGFTTDQAVSDVFSGMDASLAQSTLMEALSFGGGPGVVGAQRILLRTAVASVLNAAHPGVDYPRTASGVALDVNDALATDDRPTILALADALDADNNLGCSLD